MRTILAIISLIIVTGTCYSGGIGIVKETVIKTPAGTDTKCNTEPSLTILGTAVELGIINNGTTMQLKCQRSNDRCLLYYDGPTPVIVVDPDGKGVGPHTFGGAGTPVLSETGVDYEKYEFTIE